MKSFRSFIDRGRARDTARLAIQSAVAAASMYSLMRVFDMPEKFVGVLSAVLVVEPAVDSTMGKAWTRFVATLIGCAIGILSMLAVPDGYGTAAALAISMLALHAIAGFRPEWRYGVIAAAALSLGSDQELFRTALDRSLAIGLGVGVGVVVSIVVWGEKASTRAQRKVDQSLRTLTDYIDSTIAMVQTEESGDLRETRSEYQRQIAAARELAEAVRVADDRHLWDQIRAIDSLYGAILILERVGGEPSDVSSTDDELRRHIETIRRGSCEIAKGLAEGRSLQGESDLQAIEDAIEKIRQRLSDHHDGPEADTLRHALAFGVNEVEESIGRLIEIRRNGRRAA